MEDFFFLQHMLDMKMGMQYLICRIPSWIPQGGGECAMDPSPTQSSLREPWG